MITILKKDFNTFFASPVGYLVIGLFLIVNSLFLFVLEEDFNLLNAGFANINAFFFLAPWLLLFLIPAITMKSFAEEFNAGTIEILKTIALTNWQIIFGKFLAALLLFCLAILPTLSYVYTIWVLGNPIGNLDTGVIIGSYLGLLLLAMTFVSIGLFSSTLVKNQISAFIISVSITFFMFYGFDALSKLLNTNTNLIQQLGINEHYTSISKGVVDTRDLYYFFAVTAFFLFITKQQLDE